MVPIPDALRRSMASWPQIGMDAERRLYVLYSIALNENRGIYLTTSEDHGQTWSIAEQIFDAAAAGLQGVERPTLYVEPTGIYTPPGLRRPQRAMGLPKGFSIHLRRISENLERSDRPGRRGKRLAKLAAAENQLHLIYVQSGQLWERTLPLDYTRRVQIILAAGPIAGRQLSVYQAGARSACPLVSPRRQRKIGSLHLTGNNSQNGGITYSTCRNGSWSSADRILRITSSRWRQFRVWGYKLQQNQKGKSWRLLGFLLHKTDRNKLGQSCPDYFLQHGKSMQWNCQPLQPQNQRRHPHPLPLRPRRFSYQRQHLT